MNILIDVNPEHVTIGGEPYKINTDFRIGILFEQILQDRSLSLKEKQANAINIYFRDKRPSIATRDDVSEIMDALVWFFRCGDESVSESSEGNSEPIYCFDVDADNIYSAFMAQYGIDLQDEHLHWWKFRALFKGLNEDHLFSKIMGYRSMKITNDMSDSQKEYYRKMKSIYKLPDKRTKEEMEEDFNNSLSNLF